MKLNIEFEHTNGEGFAIWLVVILALIGLIMYVIP